jgi:hypothetical protein
MRAMHDLVAALGIDADEIVFGHTHRPGPLPEDTGWHARLFNAGSWLYEPSLLDETPRQSPYWPGCSVWLEGDRAPRLRRLLGDVTHAELGAADAYS